MFNNAHPFSGGMGGGAYVTAPTLKNGPSEMDRAQSAVVILPSWESAIMTKLPIKCDWWIFVIILLP